MLTEAEIWAWARENYLRFEGYGLLPDDHDVMQYLTTIMMANTPRYVPDPPTCGDFGYVMFSDGSEIKWDWDDGDFMVGESRLEYPYTDSDPLFWAHLELKPSKEKKNA